MADRLGLDLSGACPGLFSGLFSWSILLVYSPGRCVSWCVVCSVLVVRVLVCTAGGACPGV